MGYVGTPTGVAHLPVVTQAKVPLVGMFTGAEVLREPFNRYVFHVRASYYDETEKIVEQVVSLGGKKISVFYQADAYGEAGRKGTEIALDKRKLKIHSQGTVERNTRQGRGGGGQDQRLAARRDRDGRRLRRVRRVHPPDEEGRQRRHLLQRLVRRLARRCPTRSARTAPASRSRRWCRSPGALSVPVVKEYQQLAKKAGFTDYNFSAMEGFLSAKVMVEGLRRAGRNPTREGLVDALEKMNDVDLGGFFISYSPKNHTGSKFVDLTIIGREGKFLR